MNAETLIAALYVFALAAFLGYQVISRVPPLLHTPLMSATNAISGISLVGSIVTAGAQYNTISTVLGFTAVTCATINVVGGFIITDRMLRMFKRKETGVAAKDKETSVKATSAALPPTSASVPTTSTALPATSTTAATSENGKKKS